MGVTALWRYPVKSMQGERSASAVVGERGLHLDRAWALVDEATGYVLTARREPRLLQATGRVVCAAEGTVEVVLPDGRATTDDGELSRWLGRPVRLERAATGRRSTYENVADPEHEAEADWFTWQGPEGTFHDSTRTQLSLLSEGSHGGWDVRRFRPNVVTSGAGEDAWLGRYLRIGAAEFEVKKQIDRCVVVTRPQPGGIERDLGVLRTINRDRGTVLGIGLLVRTPGTIAIGDMVEPVVPPA